MGARYNTVCKWFTFRELESTMVSRSWIFKYNLVYSLTCFLRPVILYSTLSWRVAFSSLKDVPVVRYYSILHFVLQTLCVVYVVCSLKRVKTGGDPYLLLCLYRTSPLFAQLYQTYFFYFCTHIYVTKGTTHHPMKKKTCFCWKTAIVAK